MDIDKECDGQLSGSQMPSKTECLCDEISRLKAEIRMLRQRPQIPESALRAVWEHGNKCSRGSQWDDYSHHAGELFVTALKVSPV